MMGGYGTFQTHRNPGHYLGQARDRIALLLSFYARASRYCPSGPAPLISPSLGGPSLPAHRFPPTAKTTLRRQ